MNRFVAPGSTDHAYHRNRFEPSVRAALALLDRVAEGENVPARDVQLALQVTGDATARDFREMRGYARFARLRDCANERPQALATWRREGPTGWRERHPWAEDEA